MSIEDRSAKAIAKFKIKAMEDINENSKMNNKAKKRRLNLQVRALSVNSKHNNSLSDMLEQLNGYKNTVEKELEQINNPLPNNIQIEEQYVPDILDGKNSEQNVGLEDILKRVDILEKQIKSVFSKYQAERETRLKLENEINKRDNELTLRIACLEEKLFDKDLFNTINIESFKHQRYKINKLVIPHNTLDELIDNNVMPQLEKQTENNEMDVSFVDEVIRDYKPGMLRFKKENEMTDKVNEWPVITFENESETGGSTQNSDQLIQIKNETNNNNNIAYH